MTTQQPPTDPREPDERLPGETELAALYRRLPQQEPGPALDAAVLRAAAQAVAAQAPATRRRRPRWPIALGSAATLLLAAGLGWHMRDLPSSVQPAAVAPATGTGESARPIAAAPPPAAPAVAEEAAAPALPEPGKAPPPAMRSMAAPAPAQELAAAKRTAAATESSASRTSGRRRAPLPEVQAQPQAGTAMFRAADTAASGIPAQAAAGAPAAQAHLEQAPSADRVVPVPAMIAPPAPPAPAPASTATVPPPTTGDAPAQELDTIRRLFAQGRADEARKRLEAFHRAHPQWELPAELRAQLREP
ncbi:hypothetical protein ASG87_14225 [Frateuria sp. Soil773]|uniref:hypothetical protein n=1 Tax=Frateuria sp. Soil773 TaxID=1736407 RepID=UPI0006FFB1BA|nr:hypothetical protein [Frateuria sp. Soil773]KRE99546.1 hypothetical protein ASG87_14225 [Frateuria sp. Soil773]